MTVIGWGNLVLYLIILFVLGGSADNGMVRNGRFYVGNHGKYNEVSKTTFRLNRIHGQTVVFSVFIGAAGLAWMRAIGQRAGDNCKD